MPQISLTPCFVQYIQVGENEEGVGSIHHMTWSVSSCDWPSVQVVSVEVTV